jgi:hypothetical protein
VRLAHCGAFDTIVGVALAASAVVVPVKLNQF